MKISINKVPQLKEEPASPKFQRPTKVWGKGQPLVRRSTIEESCEDRSAAAIKQRIDRKLALLFGTSSQVHRSGSLQDLRLQRKE
jgi:hypothetical protein